METMISEQISIDKSDWTPVKFSDIVFEPKESSKDPKADGIKHVVGLEHIESEDIHLRHSANLDTSTTFSKRFAAGDVLFGRRRAYLKKAAQAKFNGICSGDITVFRAKENLMPELLPFIVNNEKFFDYAIKHSAGGLSPRVKFKDLANYEFLLPPKDQQAKLAELLWAMDEVIEKDTQLLDNIVLNLIVNEKLIFASKTYCALKTIILNSLSGGTPNTKVLEFYSNGTIPWLTTKIIKEDYIEIGEKFITNDAVLNSAAKVLPKGNIIAGTRVGVGKFSVNLCDISFSQDVTGLIIDHSKVNIDFLVYQLNSVVFQSKIEPFLRGTTIKGILKDDLLNMKIYLPSMEKQLELKNLIKEHKNSRDLTKSKISSSKALQKSLINQVF